MLFAIDLKTVVYSGYVISLKKDFPRALKKIYENILKNTSYGIKFRNMSDVVASAAIFEFCRCLQSNRPLASGCDV